MPPSRTKIAMTKQNILNYSMPEIKEIMAKHSSKGYLGEQIFTWIYQKHITDFTQMSNVAKENIHWLNQNYTFAWYKDVTIIESAQQLATKYIFKLVDGQAIETVLLKEKKHDTLCISSQIGCPIKCKFCLTGHMGFIRNLEVSEIVGQVYYFMQAKHNISNIVFMGMGEPLMNLKHVIKALTILRDEKGLNFSKRKITLSTIGYLPGLKQLINDNIQVNLAFSVGHANPLHRIRLIPAEKQHPIIQIIRLLNEYQKLHNRKITLEYTVIKNENDDYKAIQELINLAKYLKAKINLISLNEHPDLPFQAVDSKTMKNIKEEILKNGVQVSMRYKKGQDILAGCGQLNTTIS
jgi:23S rRNA (adenine2503-C2)-methyltransferase